MKWSTCPMHQLITVTGSCSVFAPDSVCMELANQSQYAAYKAIFIIMAAFAVFFIMLVVGENRRIRQNEEKEKELQDALLKSKPGKCCEV